MAVTDGAPRSSSSTQVDPEGRESAWESVLADGISASGIDPSATFEPSDDPAASAPQAELPRSSEGAGTSGSPAAPIASATGDDGQSARPSGTTASPSAVPAAPGSEPDPLAGAEPFTYAVDGQTRTMDGAFRIPGEGLYVPEDKVPQFQLIATQAATLDRQNRELYEQHQQTERLLEWKTRRQDGVNRDGSPNYVEQTLTGRDAIEARHVLTARTMASYAVLDQAIRDPKIVEQLFEPRLSDPNDPNSRVVLGLSEQGADILRTRIENAAMKAEQSARQYVGRVSAPPPPPEASPADFAPSTVKAIIEEHKVTDLTEKDKQFFESQFPRYVVRDAAGKITGYDPELVTVIKDRAALRAEQKQAASAAEAAGKFNGGMNRGRVAPRPPAPPVAPQKPATPEKVGKAAAWDNVLHDALQEINV